MSAQLPLRRRLATAARWPAGVLLTSWDYLWRTTPLYRDEVEGSLPDDLPPELPEAIDPAGLQTVADGAGALFHRRYRARIRDCHLSAAEILERVTSDPDLAAPGEFAVFCRLDGEPGEMRINDEYIVQMAGPWNGPVRTIRRTPMSFRFATLEDHLEAGQIEFRAHQDGDEVVFEIESWARSKDRLTDFLYDRLRMSKEVQLHMWISYLERIAKLAGGRLSDGIDIHTRRIDDPQLDD